MEYAQLNEAQTEAIQITTHGNVEWDATHFCPASALTTDESALFRVVPLTVIEQPAFDPMTQSVIRDGCEKVDGAWQYKWCIDPLTPEQIADNFATVKLAKNLQINELRAQANQTYFTHTGKQVACDALSRSDIDAVAGSIALTGAFPTGFPGAWKAMDNSYVMLPDVDAFKAMYASMTLQGGVNFARSQTLKGQLASATTAAQVNAIQWGA
jgi:hypothetical protein